MSVLNTFFLGKARVVTHIAGWTIIALIFFSALSAFRSPEEALGRTTLNIAIMMSLYYINARILVNHFFEKSRYGWWFALTVTLWISTAALRVLSEEWLFGGSVLEENIPGNESRVRVFLIFCFLYFLLLLFSALHQFLENRYDMEIRNRDLSALHKEAQLNYLKAQINPHFLFNTLNNIYAAATLEHPNTANMVLKLSEMLRYVTYDTQSDRLPLNRELKVIRSVIELFIMRAEKPPNIVFDITGNTEAVQIEPVLLLPLVENALKHGNLENDASAFMRVSVEITNDVFRFVVVNTHDLNHTQKDVPGGVGLSNIRNRLNIHYPETHRLIIQNDLKTYHVTLEIELNIHSK